MEIIRKQLLDEFCGKTLQNYREYCQKTQIQEDPKTIITYLIDQEIIKPVTVRHYTICREYEVLLPSLEYKKSKTVRLLAERYNLSERSVWAVVKSIENKKKT